MKILIWIALNWWVFGIMFVAAAALRLFLGSINIQ